MRTIASATALLVALFSVGCGPGGPEIAGVEGTVTMDGEPLQDASVVFAPKSGRPAGAKTDAEGKYTLNFSGGRKGAMLGENRVTISTAADPSETEDGTPVPAKPETVPARYNANTELKYEVEADKMNTANFDLTSEGPLPEADSMIQENLEGDN